MDEITPILVINLLLLVALIIVVLIWLDKYNKSTREIINQRLNILSEKTDENLSMIDDHIADFIKKLNISVITEIKKLSNTIKADINNNNKIFTAFISEAKTDLIKGNEQFKKTTKQLELDYNKYITEVDIINKRLIQVIENFNENNKQIEILTPQVEQNNKKLEKVVDKTKELIATHEVNLTSEINLFENNINDMRTKFHDSIIELASSTENALNKNVDESTNSVNKLFDEIKEKYTTVATNSLQEMKLTSEKIKQNINIELKNTDIKKVNELVTKFNSQLNQTIERNKKDLLEFREYFDEKFLEVDNKLEAVSKKRRLF